MSQAVRSEVIAGLAHHFGVPPSAVPVLVRLEIRPGQLATGWAATTSSLRQVQLPASPDWPAGALDLIGAAVDAVPAGHERPFMHLTGVVAIDLYAAQLHIPSGNAAIEVVWPLGARSSRIELPGGVWQAEDLEAAALAVRWLEALPRGAVG